MAAETARAAPVRAPERAGARSGLAAAPGAPPPGALVLGADYRALGVVRSLGRHGVPVWVIRDGDDVLATHSRYATVSLDRPPEDAGARLAHLLGPATAAAAGFALIPSSDEAAAFAARAHEALSARFAVTVPPWATMRFAYDKRLTYPFAASLGLDTPWTAYPRDRADLAARAIGYPVVVKPAVKEHFNRLTAAKAWRVDSRAELLRRYDEACTLVAPDVIMVQELIPGGGEAQLSYAALCADGAPLAEVTARRTRQYPADFGRASTYVETVECPEIREPARALLRELRWTGLVEVEFKRDPRDGGFKLLDVNPRVWGWHTLCARAGVDFPHLLWLALRGCPVPTARARAGARWVRTTTDLPVVAREVLAGRLSVRAYAQSLRGPREGAVLARDDVGPAVHELPQLVSTLVSRLAGGAGV
jgi:D-aspartate ligase